MMDLFIHIPQIKENMHTATPIYQTKGKLRVASYTAVVVAELTASKIKGSANAIPAKTSY